MASASRTITSESVRTSRTMFKATHTGTSISLGAALLVGCLLSGCDSADAADAADLPAGWEDASRIESFTQTQCKGPPYGGPAAAVTAVGNAGSVALDYEHAAFRCNQDVEGYVRRSTGKLDILVQPVEMDPDSVAKCDCLYDIVADVPAEPGSYTVTVYHRGDSKSGQSTEQVGSGDATVTTEE
jgi:hypothetical protein